MAFIYSHNIISSLGLCSEETLSGIRKGVSGIKLGEDEKRSPEKVYVSLSDENRINEAFSLIAKDAKKYTEYEKLLILSISDALKTVPFNIASKNTVFIFSTTKGNINLLEKDKTAEYETKRLKLWEVSKVAAAFFGKKDDILTISNACISGTLALITAQRLLDAGKYKHALVVGADILSEFTLSGFQAFKAVSQTPCKPFDRDRTGMTPGEGAATIVLSTDKSLIKENTVFIAGGASSNDANHISGPSRTGEELAYAVQSALNESKLSAKEIQFISGHGTATIFNDETESKALELAGFKDVPLCSLKGFFGHTFGAAGVIETVLACEAIKNSELYKTIGYENPGVSGKVKVQDTYEKDIFVESALKTASGFGGCNAALILSKNEVQKKHSENSRYKIRKTVRIQKNTVSINGNTDYEIPAEDAENLSTLAKSVYKNYGIKYPKFYKMDELSKLGFLASEILLKDTELLSDYKSEDIAVVLSNESASLNTDRKYQNTIDDRQNYYPSPGVFVYTLPNIPVGEICIRNKIKGENIVFVSETFDKDFIFDYAQILFNTGKAKVCIAGQLDYAYPDKSYIAELYLLEQNK